MLLETKNLLVRRGQSAPLMFPDLSVAAGEHLLLLGRSGTGKTTLLSMLAGLLKPGAGQILWQGTDLYALTETARDRMRGENFGFVFQTLHLLPAFSLGRNIALAMQMGGACPCEDRIMALLSRLGLAEKFHAKPQELSQGEQQRAAVARAVINAPKIIFADEPTSALDDENAAAVIALLLEQAKQTGAALILATHDARIAPHFSRRISLDASAEGKAA